MVLHLAVTAADDAADGGGDAAAAVAADDGGDVVGVGVPVADAAAETQTRCRLNTS